MLSRLLLIFITCVFSVSSHSHDVYTGETKVNMTPQGDLSLEINIGVETAEVFSQDIFDRNNQLNDENLPNIKEHLTNKAKHFFYLTLDGKKLAPSKADVQLFRSKNDVVFTVLYPGPIKGKLGLRSDYIDKTNPEYRLSIIVFDANKIQQGLFNHNYKHRYNEVYLDSSQKLSQTDQEKIATNNQGIFASFFELGLHHIVLGFDHLVFLLGLLVICRNWKHAAIIVSCFTLAHAITLSLAALNIVAFPSRWIEFGIALTIIYVGIENIYYKHQPNHRWLLTSCFGLIHGLGFANVLIEIGLGSNGAPIFLPLLGFNLGIEIGQLILALITLPILWYLMRFKWYEQKVLPMISAGIITIGVFWAVERIM